MEHVRFTNPTFIGDTIHLEVKITDIQEKDDGRGVITALQEIKKQTGKTVVVATIKLMVNKSPDY
jgi:acyl dehydratase